jgi:DNA-binding transcriptional ArsR family regulator
MDIFTAISDPTRRRIVEYLGAGAQPAGSITEQFALSAPAISQHLKVLKEASLVSVKIDGQKRIYSLNPQGLDDLEAWLGRMREFWNNSLDALEQVLRAEDAAKAKKSKPAKPKSRR